MSKSNKISLLQYWWWSYTEKSYIEIINVRDKLRSIDSFVISV